MNLYEIIITRGYDPYPIAMRYVEADSYNDAEAIGWGLACNPGEIVDEVNFIKQLNHA